jgi:hypothetical protein
MFWSMGPTQSIRDPGIRLNPHEAVALLQHLENGKQSLLKAFGAKRGPAIVLDVKQLLEHIDLMPPRPPGWVNKYKVEQILNRKKAGLLTHTSSVVTN